MPWLERDTTGSFQTQVKLNCQNALRLSHRSRIRLGLASGRSPDLRFVESEQPSQNVVQWPKSAQFSANTVAGQWRILTAFPNTRLCDLYRDAKERSNTTCEYSGCCTPRNLRFTKPVGRPTAVSNCWRAAPLAADLPATERA
jgi:hypothetical protein